MPRVDDGAEHEGAEHEAAAAGSADAWTFVRSVPYTYGYFSGMTMGVKVRDMVGGWVVMTLSGCWVEYLNIGWSYRQYL